MRRSPSLVLMISSLCALAACTRAPVASTPRQPPARVVAPEPMGNPDATRPAPRPAVDEWRLMEPAFAGARREPLGVAAIVNLEDPSQPLPAVRAKPVAPAAPRPKTEAPAAPAAPAAYDPLLDYARTR